MVNAERGRYIKSNGERAVTSADLLNPGTQRRANYAGARRVSETDARRAGFQEVLLRSGRNLTGVIVHLAMDRVLTNFLERGDRHGGQEADDDDNDHDFDEGEALGGVIEFFHMNYKESTMYYKRSPNVSSGKIIA